MIIAVFVFVITSTIKPNNNITTSQHVSSSRTTTISASPTTTTANYKLLRIANYSYDSEVALLKSSYQVPVTNGFVNGRFITYTSTNSTLLIRTITYSDNKTVNAAYDYVNNLNGSDGVYMKDMPKGYTGVILKTGNSYIYSIDTIRNYSLYTATISQNSGEYINPNATISTLLYVINNTV